MLLRRLLILLIVFFALSCSKRPDFIVNDFESETYGDWHATGNAFGPGPAGALSPLQPIINGMRGSRAANSFHNGASGRGTLMSPEFKIERRYINFLVGGGELPDSTGLHLFVDNEVVSKIGRAHV